MIDIKNLEAELKKLHYTTRTVKQDEMNLIIEFSKSYRRLRDSQIELEITKELLKKENEKKEYLKMITDDHAQQKLGDVWFKDTLSNIESNHINNIQTFTLKLNKSKKAILDNLKEAKSLKNKLIENFGNAINLEFEEDFEID